MSAPTEPTAGVQRTRWILAILATVVVVATCRQTFEPSPRGSTDAEPEPPPVAANVPEDLGARAFEHVRQLVSFGPRHSGSPGWTRAIEYITEQLTEAGLDPVLDRWTEETEGLDFCNIRVRIPGTRPERLVIGCHHDTKNTSGHDDPAHNFEFVGANDSGSGVGLLIELASVLAAGSAYGERNRLDVTVDLVFFDGEESIPFDWDIDRALFGSKRFVRKYRENQVLGDHDEGKIGAFILLDLIGSRDLQIDDDELSDAGLQRIIAAAAAVHGHSDIFFETHTRVTDDHVPFLDAAIPAIDLIDIRDNPEWHKPTDTIDAMSAQSLHIVGTVVLTALPPIAQAYLPRGPGRLKIGGPR